MADRQGVKNRFFVSLAVNTIKILLGFTTGMLIARHLGPSGYGDYNFLLGSFGAFLSLIDLGTSSAFFTFIAQRKRGIRFYLYYFYWIGIQFSLPIIIVGFFFPEHWRSAIWLNHSGGHIALAFLASFLMSRLWANVAHVGESIRETVLVQFYNILLSVVYLSVVVIFVKVKALTLVNLFIITIIIHFVFSLLLLGKVKDILISDADEKFKSIFFEYRQYCIPLIIYNVFGFIRDVAGVWFLQKFGGADQQGFFSVGEKFSTVCLLATGSMLKIFWKEMSEAHYGNDLERLRYLFERVSRVLLLVGAGGACFLIPFSQGILKFFLGDAYNSAWLNFSIILLYPIHQSLGQIVGTFFYATERTLFWAKIGILSVILDVCGSYFFLASPNNFIPGLGLGAIGLSLSRVLVQFLSVNIAYFFLTKILKLKFSFVWQFGVIGGLLILSIVSKFLLELLIPRAAFLLHFGGAGIIYGATLLIVILRYPHVFGIDLKDISGVKRFFKILK